MVFPFLSQVDKRVAEQDSAEIRRDRKSAERVEKEQKDENVRKYQDRLSISAKQSEGEKTEGDKIFIAAAHAGRG